MKQSYQDIIKRLGAPKWWDEAGCPRYTRFHPHFCNDIYARQAVLMEIKCQGCGQRFKVALSWPGSLVRSMAGLLDEELKERAEKKGLHYGDPPDNGCCPAGPTMNSIALKVLQFWERESVGEWKRNKRYEVSQL